MDNRQNVPEADPEWRQFVQQELESMRNSKNAKPNPIPKEKSSLLSLDQALPRLIEKIPFERLIDSTIRFIMKKPQLKRTSKERL